MFRGRRVLQRPWDHLLGCDLQRWVNGRPTTEHTKNYSLWVLLALWGLQPCSEIELAYVVYDDTMLLWYRKLSFAWERRDRGHCSVCSCRGKASMGWVHFPHEQKEAGSHKVSHGHLADSGTLPNYTKCVYHRDAQRPFLCALKLTSSRSPSRRTGLNCLKVELTEQSL